MAGLCLDRQRGDNRFSRNILFIEDVLHKVNMWFVPAAGALARRIRSRAFGFNSAIPWFQWTAGKWCMVIKQSMASISKETNVK